MLLTILLNFQSERLTKIYNYFRYTRIPVLYKKFKKIIVKLIVKCEMKN